jgi:hypothetical protein
VSDSTIAVIGNYAGNTDFDPGPGTDMHAGNVGWDYSVVQKLDLNGNVLKTVSFGGSDHTTTTHGGTDEFGNIYATGYFLGTTDFDPSTGVASKTAAIRDVFLLKLTPNLDFVWVHIFESVQDVSVSKFQVSEAGEASLILWSADQLDIDLTAGVNLIGDAGYLNYYLLKLDSSGYVDKYYSTNYNASTSGGVYYENFAIKPNGHYILTGRIVQHDNSPSYDFDPEPGSLTVIDGYCRASYILELSPNLEVLNARLFGDPEYNGHHAGPAHFEYIESIFFNADSEMYISGKFFDTTDLDPGPAVQIYASYYNPGVPQHMLSTFVIKLNSDYSANWIKIYENGRNTRFDDVIALDNGLIYVVGAKAGGFDFDLDPVNAVIDNSGATMYAIYDNDFNYKQHFVWGNGTGSNALSMILDKDKNLYTVGKTRGPVDFDPGPANTNVQTHSNQTSNSPYYDMYMVKYHTCDPSAANLTSTACDSFVSPSGKYNYTVSGVYKDTVYNVNGCDSIITIDLTILPKSSSTTQVISCVDYLSPSGNVYTLSGIYHDDTLTSVNGCDSILIIDLSIPVFNITTNLNATTISSNQSGVNYQWYDCLLNEDILNETNQSYTATANGEYAVILENQGCTDTSTCVKITGVGIGELSLNSAFELYPNPSTTAVYIQMNENQIIGSFKVYDMDGRLIKEGYSESSKMKLEVAKLEPGVYLIAVEGMGQKRFVCLGK